MNKLYLACIATLSAITLACTNEAKTALEVTLPESEQPSQLFLLKIIDGNWQRVDSSAYNKENGNYTFSYHSENPDFILLSKGDLNGFTYISEGTESQKVEFSNFPASFSKESTLNAATQELYNWLNTSKAFELRANELKAAFATKQMTQNTLIDQLNELQQEFIVEVKAFINQHKNSLVALSALQNLNPVDNLDLYKEVEISMEKISPNSGYLKNLRSTIKRAEEQIILQKAETEKNEKIEALLGIGKPAPNIALNTPEGKISELKDLKGKVVLVDFWASWCKPCRQENPNVVRLYNKYKKKGFEVYGVSLDKTKNAWVNAIKADNLTWTHVSDLQFWNSAAAQLYGVNSIPATFLIGKDGTIIAKNLRGASLESKLEEIFN